MKQKWEYMNGGGNNDKAFLKVMLLNEFDNLR